MSRLECSKRAVSEELYWVRTSNFGPPMLRPLVDLLAHGSLSLLLSPGCKTRKTATQRTSDVVLKKPLSASRKLATLTESVPHRRQAHVRVFVRASAFVHMACESLSLSLSPLSSLSLSASCESMLLWRLAACDVSTIHEHRRLHAFQLRP